MSDIQNPCADGKVAIAKWGEFQHYKDRNPPWVKLHRSLLSSETWVCASNEGRVLAIACMMLAAATDNEIPANKRYLRRVAYLDFEPDIEELVSLGFLYWLEKPNKLNDASNPLADASIMIADARPETEAEQSRAELQPNGCCAASGTPDDDFSFADFEEAWQEMVDAYGLPAMRAGARERRKRAFNVRKRQYPNMEDWTAAFKTLAAAKWMHGDNNRGWRCDADDFLNPTKFSRLVEGKYVEAN